MANFHFIQILYIFCVSYAAEFNFTVNVYPNITNGGSITSGHRRLSGIITVPDMFVKATTNERRRLKETPITTSNKPPTPAPTNKIILPIMLLVPPEGGQDRSVTIYGQKFNMSSAFQAGLFDQLRDQLVNDGKMAVIQYDKRNCKSWTAVDDDNDDEDDAIYHGPDPLCMEQCPDWCPRMLNACNLIAECYNDTNLTVTDLVHDAMQIWTEGVALLRQHLNGDIVELRDLWTVPVGYSAQGASIAAYLAASSSSSSSSSRWPTAISLFGASVNIDALLVNQLRRQPHANATEVANLERTFAYIRNGTLASDELIAIGNYFQSKTDMKYVQYWKDWLSLNDAISYAKLENFLAINSFHDTVIASESFESFYERLDGNTTAQTAVIRDVNHFMINVEDWQHGRWYIDDAISARIIEFMNDISGGGSGGNGGGYLDVIMQWNASRNLQTEAGDDGDTTPQFAAEDDTVYKVLLYIVIMAVICILACGVYWLMACKACPYELQDANANAEAEQQNDLNERDRERRRRRRRRRRRHQQHRNDHDDAARQQHSLLANDALVSELISNPAAYAQNNELLSDRLLDDRHHDHQVMQNVWRNVHDDDHNNIDNNNELVPDNEDQNGNINSQFFVD